MTTFRSACAAQTGGLLACSALTAAALLGPDPTLAATPASSAQSPPTTQSTPDAPAASAADLVSALQGVFGRHPGARASHATGFCAQGVFVPAPGAALFSGAAILRAAEVPALIRFSVGGGNPKAAERGRSIRGLAAQIGTGADAWTLALLSEPVFFASTPESMVSFLQARVPDPATGKPDPARIQAHLARHPEAGRQGALLAAHPAPASYGTTPYHSTHAFRFVPKDGEAGTWARLVLEPKAGIHYLSEEAEKSGPEPFLENEARARLGKGPIQFAVLAQPAGANDSLTDPAAPWASGGPARVELGSLIVQRLSAPETCDGRTFLPTNLPKGIEPSDDPILKARSAAYAVSLGQRLHR